mgnify:CR=1 FL=1
MIFFFLKFSNVEDFLIFIFFFFFSFFFSLISNIVKWDFCKNSFQTLRIFFVSILFIFFLNFMCLFLLFFSYAKRTSKAKVFSWKQANHFAKVTPEWEFRIKNQECTYNQKIKLWAFSTSSSSLLFKRVISKKKTSLWKNIEKVKMWWSHFLFLLQKNIY